MQLRFEVILLLSIFSVVYAKPEEKKFKILEKFVKTPVFSLIKDIQVWNNNEIIKLNTRIQFDPNNWMNDLVDTRHVTDVALKALCCMYSEKINELMNVIDLALTNCEEVFNSSLMESENKAIHLFNSCTSDIKRILNSHKKIINDMYLNLINFSKVFHSTIDVNFFNAIITLNIYLSNCSVCDQITVVNDQSKSIVNQTIEKLRRSNIGILKKLEAFSILSCSQPVFNEIQTKNYIKKKCNDKVDSLDNNCLDKYVNEYIFSNFELIPRLDLDVVTTSRQFYEPQNLMLSSLLDLEIINGNESTSLKHMLTVNWKGQETNIEQVSLYLSTDCHSESLIQHQLLMIDSVMSVVFYLILYISAVFHDDIVKMNSKESLPIHKIINSLDTLSSFNFQEPLNSIFKGIEYNKTYYSIKEVIRIFDLLYIHFEKSNITIKKLISVLDGKSQEELLDILDNIIKQITDKKQDITIAIEVIKKLTNYNMQESGVYLSVPISNIQSEELENYNDLKCNFTLMLKKHFLLANIILTQCKDLANKSPNSEYIPSMLIDCLNFLGRSIQSVTNKAQYMFGEISNFDKRINFEMHLNKNIINSFYSLMLLLSNSNFNDILNILKYRKPDYVLAKIAILHRYNLLIINYAEQFSVEHCALKNSQSGILEEIERKINENCNGSLNHLRMIKCIEGPMLENSTLDKSLLNKKNSLNNSLKWDNIEYSQLENLLNNMVYGGERKQISQILKTQWVDGVRPIEHVQLIMKNYIEPKYLTKYHLIILKSIIFISYEKMKAILVDVKMSQIVSIDENLQSKINQCLNFLSSWNFPKNIYIRFLTISRLFSNFIQNIGTQNEPEKLVKIIECEQYSMKITKKPNVDCLSNITTRMMDISIENDSNWFSQSKLVESEEKWYNSYGLTESDSDTGSDNEYDNSIPMSLQRLESYHNKMKNVFISLHDVLYLLESIQVFDFTV